MALEVWDTNGVWGVFYLLKRIVQSRCRVEYEPNGTELKSQSCQLCDLGHLISPTLTFLTFTNTL